jgi:hypothetical protein
MGWNPVARRGFGVHDWGWVAVRVGWGIIGCKFCKTAWLLGKRAFG